ncbi:MAG: VTT domain-containing protein [Erysipelotrichales bacterium]
MFSVENVIGIFNEYKEIAILLSLSISIIISLIGVVPSIFVTGANIIFFGPIVGFLVSILGETIGGYITFRVYRLGFKKGIENLKGKYKLIDSLINSEGTKAGILIFEGRLLPFMPSGFVTLAAALSNVGGGIFTFATLLGKIPSILLEALVSYDLINIQENYVRLIITIVTIILIVITLKKRNKR